MLSPREKKQATCRRKNIIRQRGLVEEEDYLKDFDDPTMLP